jgi:hypothetical protein
MWQDRHRHEDTVTRSIFTVSRGMPWRKQVKQHLHIPLDLSRTHNLAALHRCRVPEHSIHQVLEQVWTESAQLLNYVRMYRPGPRTMTPSVLNKAIGDQISIETQSAVSAARRIQETCVAIPKAVPSVVVSIPISSYGQQVVDHHLKA